MRIFDAFQYNPTALVMSTCCGAASGLAEVFAKAKYGPAIIFGSTDALSYSEYCVAWAILYHQLDTNGVTMEAARVALQKITAVVSDKFVYRRWDEDRSRYLYYPLKGTSYEITKTKK